MQERQKLMQNFGGEASEKMVSQRAEGTGG